MSVTPQQTEQQILSVIEDSLRNRDFTEFEANAYRQAMRLPVSDIPAIELEKR